MIVVCEPQCKGISHEKVNSGFLYGLNLAYPKEKIILFAESSHARNLRSLLRHGGWKSGFIHKPIKFNTQMTYSLRGLISYYFLFRNIFNYLVKTKTKKILFLSKSPVILFVIKLLKQEKKFADIGCTFVLHGELEDVGNESYIEPYTPVIKYKLTASGIGLIIASLRQNYDKIPSFIFRQLIFPYTWLASQYSLIFKNTFREKRILLWKHSRFYKYIALSPHVSQNASKFLNTKYLNFYTIFMPVLFPKTNPIPRNKYVKFAVFGYGDSAKMYDMLTLLSERRIEKPYEIRIISMDNRGTAGFSNVTNPSRGKILTRNKMEKETRDIDLFINLYDKTQYRFGCSLSIFEAFSYLKPVLHTANPGYDFFNPAKKPIGIRTRNMVEFVGEMSRIIENFPSYKNKLHTFRKNMVEYRRLYDIKNNLDKLKESFSFN